MKPESLTGTVWTDGRPLATVAVSRVRNCRQSVTAARDEVGR
jgi:hypothetical protein